MTAQETSFSSAKGRRGNRLILLVVEADSVPEFQIQQAPDAVGMVTVIGPVLVK